MLACSKGQQGAVLVLQMLFVINAVRICQGKAVFVGKKKGVKGGVNFLNIRISVGVVYFGVQNYGYVGGQAEQAFFVFARFGNKVFLPRIIKIAHAQSVAADMGAKAFLSAFENMSGQGAGRSFSMRSADSYHAFELFGAKGKEFMPFHGGDIVQTAINKLFVVLRNGGAVYRQIGKGGQKAGLIAYPYSGALLIKLHNGLGIAYIRAAYLFAQLKHELCQGGQADAARAYKMDGIDVG